eukprot:3608189-Pyramimonas_sp.AAC.1
MGPQNGVLGGGDACGLRHGDLGWGPLWGHEALYWVRETHADCATGTFGGAPNGSRNGVLGGGDACGLRHGEFRWSSIWGHDT